MTIDTMHDHLARFGLGQRTGIDTTAERPGVLPSTRWKRRALGQPWYPGETLSAGIGQGYMLATPLQLAAATAVVANRGAFREPRLVQWLGEDMLPVPERQPVVAEADHWEAIVDGMRAVVHGERRARRAPSAAVSTTKSPARPARRR
jgi:penicillin-binding protein 2